MPEMNQRKFGKELTEHKKKGVMDDELIQDLGGAENINFLKMLKEQKNLVEEQESEIEKFSKEINFQKLQNEQIQQNIDFYYMVVIALFLMQVFVYGLEYQQTPWKSNIIEMVRQVLKFIKNVQQNDESL